MKLYVSIPMSLTLKCLRLKSSCLKIMQKKQVRKKAKDILDNFRTEIQNFWMVVQEVKSRPVQRKKEANRPLKMTDFLRACINANEEIASAIK